MIFPLLASFPLSAAQIANEDITIHETPSGIRFGTLGALRSVLVLTHRTVRTIDFLEFGVPVTVLADHRVI